MPKNIQRPRIDPGSLTITEGIIKVEAAFHPFKERKTFEIYNGHSVLVNHRRVIGTQRQTSFGRHSEDVEYNAPANIDFEDQPLVALCKAVKLPITDGRGLTRHVERGFPFFCCRLLERGGRLF